MPLNPLIPLSSRRFNLGETVENERERKAERNRRNELLSIAKSREERAQTGFETEQDIIREGRERQATDDELRSMAVGAAQLRPLLDQGDNEAINRFMQRRLREITGRKGDPQDTIEIRDLIAKGETETAKNLLDATIRMGQERGFLQVPRQSGSPSAFDSELARENEARISRGETPLSPLDFRRERSRAEAAGRATGTRDVENERTTSQQQDATEVQNVARSLLDNIDNVRRVFGAVQGRAPSLRQETVDAEADVDRLVSLLSLDNRQKMKGSGQISDFESRLLGQAATVLSNKLISDERAEQELQKIAGVFSGQVTEAPQAALDFLAQNPSAAQQFEEKYGYLPEGF